MDTDEMTPMQRNALNLTIQTEKAHKQILFGLRYAHPNPKELFFPSSVLRAVRYIHDYYHLTSEE